MKNIIITFLVLISLSAFGQDIRKIEQDLLTQLKKVHYWREHLNDDKVKGDDSLSNANKILNQKLLNYTSKEPLTLTYDFKELQKEFMTIASSADKKFRIYSWDTELGGTQHDFENVYQYKADKIYSKNIPAKHLAIETDDTEAGKWFSEIFTIETKERKVYLGYLHSIYSTTDSYQAIKLFAIESNALNDTLQLIKTDFKPVNELGFDFNFFSVVNKKERPVKLIYYDNGTKTIKIPAILEGGRVTNDFINYKFTGQYFEKQIK
jgi:hypothetical protein